MMTKSNTYRLTNAGKKLFEVLINPDYIGLNIDELCEIADVSRHTYYRLMKEQGFVDLVSETSKQMVMNKMGDVINATYIYALGEKGHQDRKLLLEMAGWHVDKQQTQLSGAMEVNNPFAELTTEELRKLADADDND